MRFWKPVWLIILSGALLAGCASMHAADVQKAREGDKLTVGTVQREIRVGMSGAQVVEALGSPNVVTTDEKGREVWVYDRISTENVYSASSALILGILTGGSGGGTGTVSGIVMCSTSVNTRVSSSFTRGAAVVPPLTPSSTRSASA